MTKKTEKVYFSSKSEEWATPQNLFDELNAQYHFDLDSCGTKENAKCDRFITKEENALEKDWESDTCVWCNPPYGREIGKWVKKADEEFKKGRNIVMLLPARTDTKWFHEYVYGKYPIEFIKGRLRFGDGSGSAPFPSCLIKMLHIEALEKQIPSIEIPIADVAPVKHGHWKEVRDRLGDTLWQCDCCGIEWDFIEGDPMNNDTHYCPNCGARMEVEEHE